MIAILSPEEIIEAVKTLKKGAFVRLEYKSDLPVKAEYKKAGWRVVKVCEKTVRFGVRYSNIAAVAKRKAEQEAAGHEPRKVASNWVSVIDNFVSHNTQTGKDYLCVTNSNVAKNSTKVKYIVIDNEGNRYVLPAEMLNKELIIDSYWNKSETGGEVFKVAFENVIRINNFGVGFFK